ncbi:hypothetical protein lerEdw1_000567 [Lerista edwardsae]|nr:hypothetical protein lerEdw1_000567 [Lerista edwardsae]
MPRQHRGHVELPQTRGGTRRASPIDAPESQRKRIMLTKERRKQKDFFEKERLKSKMKLLDVSPLKNSGVSLDLLNLYVVNQIATRKELPDKVQKPAYVDINRGIKIPQRRHNVELPKSPESRPLEQFPVATQNRVQQQILENRRRYLLEKDTFQSQPMDTKCEDSWFPKVAHRQRNLSDPDVAVPEGLCFQQLNSREYNKTFGKSSKVTAGTDFGNIRKEGSLFADVNEGEILKTSQGDSGHPTATLFEEENEQFPSLLSEFHCSFPNENIWEQPLTDPSATNEIPNVYSPYGSQEIHQRASCAQHGPAERVLQGIFTAPEQIFTQRTQNLRVIKQEPMKNWLKDNCIQEQNRLRFAEQEENNPDFESTEGFISQKKSITVAEIIKNLLNKNKKGRVAETNLNPLYIFGLEETEDELCNYDQSIKLGRKQDDESELSSQSPSYSPKQTDSYARTTSDESEQEDQDESKSSYYHNTIPRNYDNSLTGSQRSERNYKSMDVSSVFQDCVTKRRANIQAIRGMNRRTGDATLPVFVFKHADSKTRHNAWSQTEKCVGEIKKCNAAVQCDIMQACSCNNEVSSVQGAETVTSTSKVDTTGGQNFPSRQSTISDFKQQQCNP